MAGEVDGWRLAVGGKGAASLARSVFVAPRPAVSGERVPEGRVRGRATSSVSRQPLIRPSGTFSPHEGRRATNGESREIRGRPTGFTSVRRRPKQRAP